MIGRWPVRTIVQQNITSGSVAFNWDGKDDDGYDVEPGAYTYEVVLNQTDVNVVGGGHPDLVVSDQTNYRSNYLFLERAMDSNYSPIYDVDYDGYDDKGTPDETDDDYIYLVRWYSLQDTKNASDGKLKLYDPDMQLLKTWDLPSGDLDDLAPVQTKFFEASSPDGTVHKLRVPVAANLMQCAGDYRFVLYMVDDHAIDYRDHRFNRPALDMNGKRTVVGVAIYCSDDSNAAPPGFSDYPSGSQAYAHVTRIGYAGWLPLGNPASGGSGLMVNEEPRDVIRTLFRICPTQPQTLSLHKNAVWAYYGHADPHELEFPSIGAITNNLELPSAQNYDIRNFQLGFVRLAFLAGCGTAGGSGNADANYNVSKADSIAASFHSSGAKVVVGFRNLLHSDGLAFKQFHKCFWEAVCDKRMTVDKSVKYALEHISLWARYKSNVPQPYVFGDKSIKLYPAKYGDQP